MNERRRQGLRWRVWRRLWPGYQRALDWWNQYAGSVAFASLVLVVAYGFWVDRQRIERLETIEFAQAKQTLVQAQFERQRLADRLAAAQEHAEREKRIAAYTAEQARQLELAQRRAVRRANVNDCERLNELRQLLRRFADQQLTVAQRMPLRETTLQEYVALMGDYQQSLVNLRTDMRAVNCRAAYPEIP